MKSRAVSPVLAYFQACAHGGLRPKWPRFRSWLVDLSPLRALCPGDHYHAPWGAKQAGGRGLAFATADEAEYPELLCQRLAALFKGHAQKLGWSSGFAESQMDSKPPSVNEVCMPGQTQDMAAPAGHKRASAGLQPRGFRCKQLVPEGTAVSVLSVPSGSSEAAVLQAHGLEGQRILRREIG